MNISHLGPCVVWTQCLPTKFHQQRKRSVAIAMQDLNVNVKDKNYDKTAVLIMYKAFGVNVTCIVMALTDCDKELGKRSFRKALDRQRLACANH